LKSEHNRKHDMKSLLQGEMHTFGFGDGERAYAVVTLPFGEARQVFRAKPYSPLDGKGEQRGYIHNHAKALKKEMLEGRFVPTAVHVGLRASHAGGVAHEGGDETVTLVVDSDDPLPLTDGQHRFGALNLIRDEAEKRLRKARADEEREAARALISCVDGQHITALVHLDGSPQDDFVALQKGRAVDASHLLSLRIRRSLVSSKDGPHLKLAFAVAELLAAKADSPFFRQVRFASTGFAPLPLSTLCSKGASDVGTSLVGLARVGLAGQEKSAEWLAGVVASAFAAVQEHAPELMEEGKVLTPPPDGTKGGATLLIGLGVALAYRLRVTGADTPTPHDLTQLVHAARETLDGDVNGNLSGPIKRKLLGEFAREFFADLADVEKHDGIPLELLKTLSPSAFGAAPLPKQPKQGKGKVAEEVTTAMDVIAEAVAEPVQDFPPAPPPADEPGFLNAETRPMTDVDTKQMTLPEGYDGEGDHELDAAVPYVAPGEEVPAPDLDTDAQQTTDEPGPAADDGLVTPPTNAVEQELHVMPQPNEVAEPVAPDLPADEPNPHVQGVEPVPVPSVARVVAPSEPKERFGVIVVDAPKARRSLEQVRALAVGDVAADDCVLWLWIDNQHLPDALATLRKWGFQYKTMLTCVRATPIDGDVLKEATETCLVAVRGQPQLRLNRRTNLIRQQGDYWDRERRPEFFRLVNEVCHGCGRKGHLFAHKQKGWTELDGRVKQHVGTEQPDELEVA
jgi:N6-adenosine-specific RNA methylase IME4